MLSIIVSYLEEATSKLKSSSSPRSNALSITISLTERSPSNSTRDEEKPRSKADPSPPALSKVTSSDDRSSRGSATTQVEEPSSRLEAKDSSSEEN